jgi:DNA-binding response OmpR family regulator
MARTVLIAAHDPWFLQLLRMYTEESGFKAVQVHEGEDVLPMIRLEHPVAVLLQVDLPGQVKSWDILKSLHQEGGTHPVPVLVFTWHDQILPADAMENVAIHLQEPVTFEAFTDAFQKLGLNPVR